MAMRTSRYSLQMCVMKKHARAIFVDRSDISCGKIAYRQFIAPSETTGREPVVFAF
jgi:hypothetical protein